MKLNIKEFLEECGLEEQVYPGKRVVKKLPQAGENKSHSVVYDWRSPEKFRVEVKAGLSGKDLELKELKKFPVSFQAPTYIDIKIDESDNDNVEDEEEEGKSGKGGGGGKKPAQKKRDAFAAFSQVVEGKIPDAGAIKKMVVMGKNIAKTAFEPVLKALTAQIKDAVITPVNIAAEALKVKKATPSGGLAPKGNEDMNYKYKGNDMFGVPSPG